MSCLAPSISRFSVDDLKVVPLNVAIILCLNLGGFIYGVCFGNIVPFLSFLWCLRKAVFCDYGISWVFGLLQKYPPTLNSNRFVGS